LQIGEETMTGLTRRTVIASAATLPLTVAHADNQPLRIVVGFPAGAGIDTVARLIGEKMRTSLGRPVLIENKPGAAGIIANMAVKSAAPDGNTVLMTPLATMVAYPHSYIKLDYDPFTDYAPIAHIAAFQLAFGVGPNVPAKTLPEYVTLTKGSDAYRHFASAAVGSLPHFFGLLFAKTAGLELTHVPYRGTAAVLPALLSGEIPAAVVPLSDLGPFAQAGKARVLATSGGTRSPQFPEVPTFKESGYDIEGAAWYALFAPAKTPKAAIERLAAAAIDAVRQPDVKQRAEPMGLEMTGLGPAELAAVLKADDEKWGPVIRASGFKAN
jgi:tripartite-type tricarboxylate transporter receptor subunit TctC